MKRILYPKNYGRSIAEIAVAAQNLILHGNVLVAAFSRAVAEDYQERILDMLLMMSPHLKIENGPLRATLYLAYSDVEKQQWQRICRIEVDEGEVAMTFEDKIVTPTWPATNEYRVFIDDLEDM